MEEYKIKSILSRKFKTPYIKNLSNILFDLNKHYPNQIKGLINQNYKQKKLINYVLNQACYHHNSLPLAEDIVKKYIIKYFNNNKTIGDYSGN